MGGTWSDECFKYCVMLKVVTVVVKFKISRSRNKVLLWQELLWGSVGGRAISGPEAALPAVVGRHSILCCELFVAPWGTHSTLSCRARAREAELEFSSSCQAVCFSPEHRKADVRRELTERAWGRKPGTSHCFPRLDLFCGAVQQPGRRWSLSQGSEAWQPVANPVEAGYWQGVLPKFAAFYD